jgi:hypothetical protein
MEGRTDLSSPYYGAKGIVNGVFVHHELIIDVVGALVGGQDFFAEDPLLRYSDGLLAKELGHIQLHIMQEANI